MACHAGLLFHGHTCSLYKILQGFQMFLLFSICYSSQLLTVVHYNYVNSKINAIPLDDVESFLLILELVFLTRFWKTDFGAVPICPLHSL